MVMIIKRPLAEMVCPHILTLCVFHIRSVFACSPARECVLGAPLESVCVCVCVCEREGELECERERQRERERETPSHNFTYEWSCVKRRMN